MNKAKRVLDHMASENASAICAKIGAIDDGATREQQAEYINEILNTAQRMHICTVDKLMKAENVCKRAFFLYSLS